MQPPTSNPPTKLKIRAYECRLTARKVKLGLEKLLESSPAFNESWLLGEFDIGSRIGGLGQYGDIIIRHRTVMRGKHELTVEHRAGDEALALEIEAAFAKELTPKEPRMAPGLMLHSLLETLDFARAAEDTEYCYAETLRKLTLSGLFQGKSAAQKEPMARKVADALPLWMKQPLTGSGLILAKTPKNGRSAEMRFSLRCALNNSARKRSKIPNTWQEDIVKAFQTEYVGTPKEALIIKKEDLSSEAIEGLLNGSIDMAITHQSDGRIYIIDWKSNKLGYLQEHYEADKLINGVLGHCYQLQYTLYAAALHLHMRSCLKTWKYDDFGGCHYLFLRAFGHGNNNAGDFFHRPSWDQISSVLLALGFTSEEIN